MDRGFCALRFGGISKTPIPNNRIKGYGFFDFLRLVNRIVMIMRSDRTVMQVNWRWVQPAEGVCR
jgi:hypothetical protein